MQISSIAAVCVIILSCFGVMDNAAKKIGLSPFSICFAAISYIALSVFSISPMAEVHFNIAAVFLPAYFALFSLTKHEKGHGGAFSATVLFAGILAMVERNAASYFVIAMCICCLCIHLLFGKNTAFALMLAAVLPIAQQIFATVFDYMTYSYAALDLSSSKVLDIQLLSVILTGVIMTLFASDSKVIKA